MKNKILATLLVAGALGTAAFAYSQDCQFSGQNGMVNTQGMHNYGMQQGMMKGQRTYGQGMPGYGSQHGMMNNQRMHNYMMKGQSTHRYGMNQKTLHGQRMHQGMHGFGMQLFSGIDLTNEQSYKLSILRDEMHLEMRKLMGANPQQHHMMNFVTDKGFDKDTFIKEMDTRHQQMLNIRATLMEKAFKVLTKEQIVELKKNLEAK